MTPFEVEWSQWYGGHSPAGYALREGRVLHWQRFHSLPKSKRYADTDIERAVILDRMNTIAFEVLGGDPCWIVQLAYSPLDPKAEVAGYPLARLDLPHAFVFEGDDDEPCGEGLWTVSAAATRWRHGVFNDTLRGIADDKAVNTLWMSRRDGSVFAPYDGGVDLFLPTAGEATRLRQTYADWLPTNSEGL